MSAFLSFSQTMRHIVKAQNPNLTNVDLSSVLAQKWRSSSDEAKRPHIERELNDRIKYHENMAKWKEAEEQNRQEKSNSTGNNGFDLSQGGCHDYVYHFHHMHDD